MVSLIPLAISLAFANLVEALIIGPVDGEIIIFPLLTGFLGSEVPFALFLVLA